MNITVFSACLRIMRFINKFSKTFLIVNNNNTEPYFQKLWIQDSNKKFPTPIFVCDSKTPKVNTIIVRYDDKAYMCWLFLKC